MSFKIQFAWEHSWSFGAELELTYPYQSVCHVKKVMLFSRPNVTGG